MKKSDNLFGHFRPVSKEEWLARIEKDLKGKPPAEFNADIGGIEMGAFFHPDDVSGPGGYLNRKTEWETGEDIYVGNDLNQANRQALQALTMGVNAPRFICEKNLAESDLETLLKGIHLQMVSVHFFLNNQDPDPLSLYSHLDKYQKNTKVDPQKCRTSFNWKNERVDQSVIRKILLQLKQEEKPVKLLTVNGQEYFDEVQTKKELARVILEGINFIDTFGDETFSPSFLHQHIQFSISVGKDFFLQIAKVRALNLLWANVLKAWGADPASQPAIEAHFAPGSLLDDPDSNRIAATTQAMSAIIGGVDRLTVLPADAKTQTGGTEFSRRIARNVQHILRLESHLDWIADPAAGSYYVEELTVKLAEEAWKIIGEKG